MTDDAASTFTVTFTAEDTMRLPVTVVAANAAIYATVTTAADAAVDTENGDEPDAASVKLAITSASDLQ